MFVRYWMTPKPVTVAEDTSLCDTWELMVEKDLRRLIVVRGKEVCGIISQSDLYRLTDPTSIAMRTADAAATLCSEFKTKTAGDLMTPSPLLCAMGDPLEDVGAKMKDNRIAALPVVKGHSELVGIITETDIFRALMQITSAGAKGRRLSFQVRPEDKQQLYQDVFALCETHGVEILTLLSHPMEGKDHFALLRVDGGDVETLVEALWDNKYRVLEVS